MTLDRFPLAKSVTRAYMGKGDTILRFQYNPPSFKDSNGVTYSEINSLGVSYPILQYAGGKTRKITFDIYVNGTAGDGPQKVYDVQNVLESYLPKPKHQQFLSPDTLIFAFGSFVKECLLETYDPNYTSFTPQLEPLEATFSVTLLVVQA